MTRKEKIIGALLLFLYAGFFFISQRKFSGNHGLTGQYYRDKTLSDLAETRIDPQIDFSWGRRAPMKTLPPDKFSVQWTGLISVPEDGLYRFQVFSDDGARVWVSNFLILDSWRIQKDGRDFSQLNLKKGDTPIRVEYFENRKKAHIQLFWLRPGKERYEIIPWKFLRPS